MKHALLPFAILLCSCHVKNQVYNRTPQSIVRIETTGNQPDQVDANCDPNPHVATPHACLAFIEFDEMGEAWDAKQTDEALKLIKRAKGIEDHTIVVTFTHGWKNNAEERPLQNHNVAGFEGVLEYLRGQFKYKDYPIVGIYLSWRGDLIPEAWPMRRQLSYFDREAAATRVPGSSMTAALTQIMIETHRRPPNDTPSAGHVIMVGHSFGGLVLERALSQAMTDYVLRSQDPTRRDGAEGAWADLVVFVNSAGAASEGKQMLDFLQGQQVQFRSPYVDDPKKRTAERPLLVSISSVGDAATRFAMPVGHGLSFLNRKIKGSWRDYGILADSRPAGSPPLAVQLPTAQSAYYMSTTAHMEALQSHLIVNVADSKDMDRCKDSSGNAQYFGDPFPVIQGQNMNQRGADTTLHYQICEKPGRWNDTLYWAMQMPSTIVPDHGKIFNLNFVTLVDSFFLDKTEMANPDMRPKVVAK